MDPFLQDDAPSTAKFDPVLLLRKFWRRRWLFFVPFVLCLAMATIAIKVMTPIYEAAGQVRVVRESLNSRLIDDTTGRYRRARDMDDETLSSIWTIVTAPKFLEMVARDAELVPSAVLTDSAAVASDEAAGQNDPVIAAANRLKRQVRVRPDGVHIFEVAVRNEDPQEALALARIVLDKFLEEERANRMAPRTTTRDFLDRQRQAALQDLNQAEDAVNQYQSTILNQSLAGNPVNAANLSTAETNLRQLQERLAGTDMQELRVEESHARTVVSPLPDLASFMSDAEVATVIDQIRDLVTNQLLGTTGVSDRDNEIGLAKLRLNNLLDQMIGTKLPQLGVMDRSRLTTYLTHAVYRRAQQKAIDTLSRYVRDYHNFTTRQPGQSARLSELQDEVQRRRDMLSSIERDLAQQTMNLEASMSEIGYRIEVRRDPMLPTYPVEPDKLKLYVMGFGLSFAIGIGLVVLSIMLDRSFTSVDDIERTLGIEVIGTLPVIQDDHFQKQRRRRILRWTILVVLILAVASVVLFYLYPRLS